MPELPEVETVRRGLAPVMEGARFVEVVETELMSLHDGNIARYRLRPSEYQAWRKTWN